MISLRPYAPTGIPAPMILPWVTRSGGHAEIFCSTAKSQTETSDNLVKDRRAPYSSQSFLRPSREPLFRRDVHPYWRLQLYDNSSSLSVQPAHQCTYTVQIIINSSHGISVHPLGRTGTVRNTACHHTGRFTSMASCVA